MQWILSPDGRQFRSRYTAVQDMIKRENKRRDVEEMKELMILHEGWQRSDLMPNNWLFKVVCEGFTKDKKWYSTIHYFSDQGDTFVSMKGVLKRLKEVGASPKVIENCNQFMLEQKPANVKYDWSEGDDTVPKGWKLRISESESEWQWMLNPEGFQFRSRYTAVQDMIKKKQKKALIDEMKELMVMHEGWKRSELLPVGWLYKVKSEGVGPNGQWYSTIHYFSVEGTTFESMKSVLDFIQTSKNYTEEDIVNGKTFLNEQKAPEKKYRWKEGDDSVPKGWKTRVSGGEGEWEWILSPDGRMFRSRVLAVEDMVRRGCSKEEQEDMKAKMAFEGWQKDPSFPEGWLVKKWEGKTRLRGKLNHDLKFFSREGQRLESFKMVLEAMSSSPNYTVADEDAVKKFREQWSISQRVTGFEWETCDLTLPEGWKKRRGKGKMEAEMVLSPGGMQFRSRYSALLSLYKEGAGKKEVVAMRSKLQFEGWETADLLPTGWMYKRTWEGLISSGSFSTNTVYITREGNVFESVKLAVEFMESLEEEYTEKDIEQFKAFQVQLSRVTTKRRDDWVEADTVPPGWMVRPGAGKETKEWVLRPDGRQFMTRCIALQYLAKEGADQKDIDLLRESLIYEGWQVDELLPKDWLFKVKEGKLGSTNGYKLMCKEGQLLESAKAAMDYIQVRIMIINTLYLEFSFFL